MTRPRTASEVEAILADVRKQKESMAVIGASHGVSRNCVQKIAAKHGVKGKGHSHYISPEQWEIIEGLLGTMPDLWISELPEITAKPDAISKYRRKLGIPPYKLREGEKRTAVYTENLLIDGLMYKWSRSQEVADHVKELQCTSS